MLTRFGPTVRDELTIKKVGGNMNVLQFTCPVRVYGEPGHLSNLCSYVLHIDKIQFCQGFNQRAFKITLILESDLP